MPIRGYTITSRHILLYVGSIGTHLVPIYWYTCIRRIYHVNIYIYFIRILSALDRPIVDITTFQTFFFLFKILPNGYYYCGSIVLKYLYLYFLPNNKFIAYMYIILYGLTR